MRWMIARLAARRRPKVIKLESPIRTLAGGGNDYTYDSVKSARVEVPDKFNFAQDVIDDFAGRDDHKDRDALFHVSDGGAETHWSYSDLSALSKKAAAALAGLQAGRAVTVLPRVPEWWLLNVAALRSGTVLLPGTTLLSASDLAHRMTVSGADTVIADAATAAKVEEALGQMKGRGKIKHKVLVGEGAQGLHAKGWVLFDDLMNDAEPMGHRETDKSEVIQVFFTSGTTGAPKMVPHTQASYGYCHRLTGEYWLDLAADDVHWNISDTGWAKSAWSSVFAPWSRGACAFAHAMARFSARDVLRALDRYPVTTLCAPPTLYRSLVLEDLTACSFPTLRHCVSAGEPLNEEVILSWEAATGILIKEGYGQTETTLVTANFKGFEVRPGSMGKAAPGYDVRIVDNMGREVARGEQGNIGIRVKPDRPPGLFAEYVGEPERTEGCFSGDFYLTGDRGSMDQDGYIWFSARDDDIIISAGYRIGPFEVESALLEHPSVAESAAVAAPDAARGQVVKAFVVPTPASSSVLEDRDAAAALAQELQDFVKSRTAPYKYPRRVEFVSQLPKTVSGKIRRTELRKKEERRLGKA